MCRKSSLRVSDSGDSRTVSDTSEHFPASNSVSFAHEHEGGSKPNLSNMLSRLSFRRPH